MVQNYIQTLNYQNYRFSKGRIDDNGIQIDFEFDKHGNMVSFSGSDIQLEQFKQRYLKTPLSSLSSLIPKETFLAHNQHYFGGCRSFCCAYSFLHC